MTSSSEINQAAFDKIKNLGQAFFAEAHNAERNRELIEQYRDVMYEVVGPEVFSHEAEPGINLGSGEAIGTAAAARCITDGLRTWMFVKGICDAINQLLADGKKTVHIFYAGTGPYATLLLPLLTNFSPEQLRCSLLEINPMSFDYLKKVFKQLGLEAHVDHFILGNAVTHQFEQPEAIDILVTETMQNALKNETHVPIVLNLIPQLKEEVIMIPERIKVEIALLDFNKYQWRNEATQDDNYGIDFGTLMQVDVMSIRNLAKALKSNKGEFPITEFTIPDYKMIKFTTLTLLTTIQTFGDNHLDHMECELTNTFPLLELTDIKGDRAFKVQYKIGEVPGFYAEFEESTRQDEYKLYTTGLRLEQRHF